MITGLEAAESVGGVKVFHSGTQVHNGQPVTAGGRVLGVTAIAEDLPSAVERAYTAVGKIQFEGIHYRRDIGAKGLQRLKRPRERKSPGVAPRGSRLPKS